MDSRFLQARIASAALALSWPVERFHFERFTAEGSDIEGDSSFEIQLGPNGRVLHVLPSQTIVDVLSQHGQDIPISCGQGVCGTCLTGVLEGEQEHRDMYLTPEEQARNDQFLPCCSRSRSTRLVLDL